MSNGKFRKFIIPKILITLWFLVVTVLMFVAAIDSIQQATAGDGWAGLGYAIVIIYGGFALAFSLVLSLIFFIVAKVKKNKGLTNSGTVLYFLLLTVLPIVVYGIILSLSLLI